MNTCLMFMDCPAYLNPRGTVRCGLPAEVLYRYAVTSTDGPLECARIGCPNGHWFNGPVESLCLGHVHQSNGHALALDRPGPR